MSVKDVLTQGLVRICGSESGRKLTTSGVLVKLAVNMNNDELDDLRIAYKDAVDKWVAAIRAEEALATPDHSETAMERWDEAHFREQDAQTNAITARDAYKDGLRRMNFGF